MVNILEKAQLKDITLEDLRMVLEWRNQEFIREMMFDNDIITIEQHTKWFNHLQDDRSAITKVFYYDGIPYGVLNITNIDLLNRTCEWGFYIGNQTAPKGMGTILGYSALHYIFYDLEIQGLSAKVLDYNSKSIHFHKKLGFLYEGILSEALIKKGESVNIHLFSYSKSRWNEKSIALRASIERSSK